MKVTLIAEAIFLLAVITISQSLPLGSSNPEEAQSVIPLVAKPTEDIIPKEIPTSIIDSVKAETLPEESAADPKPEEKLVEVKSAEPQPELIPEQAIITPSADDKVQEIVAVIETEIAAIKEEEAAAALPEESAKTEAIEEPKLEEAAVEPTIIPKEEKLAEEDLSKGLITDPLSVEAEAAHEKKPEEEAAILSHEIPLAAKSEDVTIEKEAHEEIPEIEEEKKIDEAHAALEPSSHEADEHIELKKLEETITEVVASPKEERSEIAVEEPLEAVKQVEEEAKAEEVVLVEEKSVVKEEEVVAAKEEVVAAKEEEKKEEAAIEEVKEAIKTEELPEAQKLKEPVKQPEDSKESSEESDESEERSQEKDKNAVKNEDDSSQEQSEEEPEKPKRS